MASAEPVDEDRQTVLRDSISREAMEVTCEACKLPLDVMTSRQRSKAHIAFARQIAMYLCHVVGQMSLAEISSAFARDRTTVGHACHIIEDRRDSPFFDRQIEVLENQMRSRLNAVFTRYGVRPITTELDVKLKRMHIERISG